MDTIKLLERADLQLQEVSKKHESDKGRLKELKEIRGNELADELIETKPERAKKIAGLDKEIEVLKINIGSSPLIIDGLKRAKLKLLSQKEKEEKDKAKNSQVKLELSLNSTSQKLVELLKQVVALNSKLKDEWASWDKLDLISGKGLCDKKTIRPSVEGIDKICGTLINEWDG
ncbi:unnamed protein product, partial [marine sediment metagenome]